MGRPPAKWSDMRRDLVVRAQHGDAEAFSELAAGLTTRLFATARLIVRSDERAADVVQDAMLRAWLDLPGLRDPDAFEAWVHRLLTRSCYRAAKRQRSREIVELHLESLPEPAVGDAQQSTVIRDQLERGFVALNTDQRVCVVLHLYLGMTLEETADVVGVPLGTVQSRIHRAMRAMRAVLEGDEAPAARRELAR
jgi:RNA polymerase sigma-70 factor, ECF subfamily